MSKIAPQRIGSGVGFFVAGAACGLIGLWGLLAGSPLDRSPSVIGAAFLLMAAGLIGVGFWVRLFGLVEKRLVDIQAAVLSERSPVEEARRSATKDPLGVDHLF